ncbi:MAG: ATP-grasp domain-containing protein [Pseudomonadota bacterium]
MKANGSSTVLLTVGRLPVALEIARGFTEAGWRVVVAETSGLHLCRVSRAVARTIRVPGPQHDPAGFREALRSIVRQEHVALIVPVSEETPHVAKHLNAELGGTRVFCADSRHVLRLHDKLAFNRLAGDLDLTVPKSWPADAAHEAAASGDALVAKPRFGCSGRGIRYYRQGETPVAGPGDLIQSRVDGDLISTCGVCWDGRLLCNAIYRARVVSGSVAVAFERVDDAAGIDDWVRRFAGETKHTGFLAFDFILDAQGTPQAIECNPRATSGIHFFASGVLASLIGNPGDAGMPAEQTFRPDRRLTEAYSCYTALLAALPDTREAGRILSELRAARDVTWRRDDPWPFLSMTINSWPIIRRSLRTQRPFAEVAMEDIEWRESYD